MRSEAKFERGFTLLELVVVLAIMLAVTAIALPQFLTAVSDYKLKSTMGQVAGMLQQQRMQAVRFNAALSVSTTTQNGRSVGWVDLPGGTSGSFDAGEPYVMLPKNLSVVNSGAPTFDTSSVLGYTAQTVGTTLTFNARGLPCIGTTPCSNIDTSTNPAKPVGFVLYFKNDKSFGVSGWGAVTITPAGRIRSWFYNGSSYSPM